MRLTKLGHACVRLEEGGSVLVVDPGGFTEDAAVDGADAVLVTHEHPDHLDQAKLRRAVAGGATVWTNAGVAARLDPEVRERVRVVAAGEGFEAAGFGVRVYGSDHAVVRPEVPAVANTGFLVGGVFHPGDAFTVPDQPVDTLLLPINAPWAKVSETVGQLAELAPTRVHPVHDALLSEAGRGVYGPHAEQVSERLGARFRWLRPGESVDL